MQKRTRLGDDRAGAAGEAAAADGADEGADEGAAGRGAGTGASAGGPETGVAADRCPPAAALDAPAGVSRGESFAACAPPGRGDGCPAGAGAGPFRTGAWDGRGDECGGDVPGRAAEAAARGPPAWLTGWPAWDFWARAGPAVAGFGGGAAGRRRLRSSHQPAAAASSRTRTAMPTHVSIVPAPPSLAGAASADPPAAAGAVPALLLASARFWVASRCPGNSCSAVVKFGMDAA